MNNKKILLAMVVVFTSLSCFIQLFLIPLCLAVIAFFTLLLFDFLKDSRLSNEDKALLNKRISDLEDKFNKSSLKLLNK